MPAPAPALAAAASASGLTQQPPAANARAS
jgi:hypothetical protein